MSSRLGRVAAYSVVALTASLALAACDHSSDGAAASTSPSATVAPATSRPASNPASTAPSAKPAKSACDYLTLADVTSVMGDGFSPNGESDGVVGSFSQQQCGYVGPEDRTIMVQTNVDNRPGGTVWQAAVKTAQDSSLGPSVYIPFTGVGDEAFFASSGVVNARKGVTVVEITLLGEETNDNTMPLLRQLAAKAMGHAS